MIQDHTQASTQKDPHGQPLPSSDLDNQNSDSPTQTVRPIDLDAIFMDLVPHPDETATTSLKDLKALMERNVQFGHDRDHNPGTLTNPSPSNPIESIDSQRVIEPKDQEKLILAKCNQLTKACQEFNAACKNKKSNEESKAKLFQNIQESILQLNPVLDSESDRSLGLNHGIKKTLTELLYANLNTKPIDRSDNTTIVYHNPSFMIVYLILKNTGKHLDITDIALNRLCNIFQEKGASPWLLDEQLAVIKLIYDHYNQYELASNSTINDTKHSLLFYALLKANNIIDNRSIIEYLCRYGLNIKTMIFQKSISPLHYVITQHKKAKQTIKAYKEKIKTKDSPTPDQQKKKKRQARQQAVLKTLESRKNSLYKTFTLLLKFIPTTDNKENCKTYYQTLQAHAEEGVPDQEIVVFLDEKIKNPPQKQPTLQEVSKREAAEEAMIAHLSQHVLTDITGLKFVSACCRGDAEAIEKEAKNPLTPLNMGFVQPRIGITTGLIYMLSQISDSKEKTPQQQQYAENYFKTVELLLRDYPEKLDLILIDRSKLTAFDRILKTNCKKRNRLIDLILQALTSNNTDSPYKKDLKKKVLSQILWSSFKYSLPAEHIITQIMELNPDLSESYPDPIPGGTILHQIVFQSTEFYNKKKGEHSHIIHNLITKIDCILPDITLEIINKRNHNGKDVIAYADETQNVYPDIIERIKNRKEKLEEEAKQKSTANQEESSPHQLDLAQSNESGQRKRKRASSDDDLDSDNGASSSVKQQKKDSRLDGLTVSCAPSLLKEHTWTQPSSPQKTIQAENKDHVDVLYTSSISVTVTSSPNQINHDPTQVSTQKDLNDQPLPSSDLDTQNRESQIQTVPPMDLDSIFMELVPQPNETAPKSLKDLKALMERNVQCEHNPVILTNSSPSNPIEPIGSQGVSEPANQTTKDVLSAYQQLPKDCQEFHAACTATKNDEESKAKLCQSIQKSILQLNRYFDSKPDRSLKLTTEIKELLKNILQKNLNSKSISRSDKANSVYHNPSFMIVYLILKHTFTNLDIKDIAPDLLCNIFRPEGSSPWLLDEQLAIIKLVYDHYNQYDLASAKHSLLFDILLKANRKVDSRSIIEYLCRAGLNIKTMTIPGFASPLHYVLTQYKEAKQAVKVYLEKIKQNGSSTPVQQQKQEGALRSLESKQNTLYKTCTLLLKFIPTTDDKANCEAYYEKLQAHAEKGVPDPEIVALLDEKIKNPPKQQPTLQEVSKRTATEEAMIAHLPQHVLTDTTGLKFVSACCRGDADAIKKEAAVLTHLNMGFIQSNNGMTTGLMYMISQILGRTQKNPKKQEYSENYFQTVELLLRDYLDKLDLRLINGSKMTALDRIFTLPASKYRSLIDLILQALTPNDTDTPFKMDLKKQMLSHVLWSSFKCNLPITQTIQTIMKRKPDLSTGYPYPIPGGTILHQIVFQSTELYNKTTGEPLAIVDHLIKKTQRILPDITSNVFKQCNHNKKDVMTYAQETEDVNPKIITKLKNKKKQLENKSKKTSTANKKESSVHQLDLAQAKESGQRKRKRASSFVDDLYSDESASSSVKKQKKDSDLDCLNVSFVLSSLKGQTLTQPSSPQKTIQAENKDHMDMSMLVNQTSHYYPADTLNIGNHSDY